jgi:hypothetical protein
MWSCWFIFTRNIVIKIFLITKKSNLPRLITKTIFKLIKWLIKFFLTYKITTIMAHLHKEKWLNIITNQFILLVKLFFEFAINCILNFHRPCRDLQIEMNKCWKNLKLNAIGWIHWLIKSWWIRIATFVSYTWYVSDVLEHLNQIKMTTIMKNFPLLNEIDNQINSDNIDWNKNAFQTLLVCFFLFSLNEHQDFCIY